MAASLDSMSDLTESINDIVKENFCQKDLRVLKSLTTALREQEYRDSVPEDVLRGVMTVLTRLLEEIQAGPGEDDQQPGSLCLLMTAECFRGLRNACVQNTHNQNLLRELDFIEVSLRILEKLSEMKLQDSAGPTEALRCGIQFLGNLAVGNQLCKDHIWKLSVPLQLLKLMSVSDEKVVGYSSMVLHTCLDQAKVEQLAQPENIRLARKVMELCRTQPDLDWTVLIATQHFLKSLSLVESMYSGMDHHERVTLLELISAQLGEVGVEESGILPGLAGSLAAHFQEGCMAVLRLASGSASHDEEALTVISLLDVLCEMTSDHRQFMFLQDHPDLLKTTVELLQQVHALGKSGQNVFTSAQNFSPGAEPSPSVSFKAHLVRLIGNLSHGHTHNQNMVRDLEGIPLILDNCSIDSKNPFISQWAIFTIRNLLEHNPENQKVVAALVRQGIADDSALRNLGFRLEERDGSLLLKPVSKEKGDD